MKLTLRAFSSLISCCNERRIRCERNSLLRLTSAQSPWILLSTTASDNPSTASPQSTATVKEKDFGRLYSFWFAKGLKIFLIDFDKNLPGRFLIYLNFLFESDFWLRGKEGRKGGSLLCCYLSKDFNQMLESDGPPLSDYLCHKKIGLPYRAPLPRTCSIRHCIAYSGSRLSGSNIHLLGCLICGRVTLPIVMSIPFCTRWLTDRDMSFAAAFTI